MHGPWRVALVLTIALSACVPPRTPGPRPLRTGPTSCASDLSGDTTIYNPSQLSELPIARTVPQLTYPAEARQRRVQGRVVITAVVNSTGDIDQRSVTVTHGVDPQLDARAREFVAGATLWPGCREGRAVRVRIDVPVEFVSSSRPLVGFWTAFGIGVLGGIVAAIAVGAH